MATQDISLLWVEKDVFVAFKSPTISAFKYKAQDQREATLVCHVTDGWCYLSVQARQLKTRLYHFEEKQLNRSLKMLMRLSELHFLPPTANRKLSCHAELIQVMMVQL